MTPMVLRIKGIAKQVASHLLNDSQAESSTYPYFAHTNRVLPASFVLSHLCAQRALASEDFPLLNPPIR
jgi:hypothetical protein